jgi:hypothetical protein
VRLEHLVRPEAFRPEAVARELPVALERLVVAPAFLAVAELELPVARPVPFPVRPPQAADFPEAAVAARAFAAVEQTQSAQ